MVIAWTIRKRAVTHALVKRASHRQYGEHQNLLAQSYTLGDIDSHTQSTGGMDLNLVSNAKN